MEDGKTQTPQANEAVDADNSNRQSLYEKTEAVVQRQEAANKKTEELLERQETLHANQRLAGTTGGAVPVAPAKEETAEDYSQRIMKGGLKE